MKKALIQIGRVITGCIIVLAGVSVVSALVGIIVKVVYKLFLFGFNVL